jgi:cell division inhibitor SulA
MAPLPPLTYHEQAVVEQMKQLSQQSKEWKLTITMHQRVSDSYLQLEPTPYIKVKVADKFELVD